MNVVPVGQAPACQLYPTVRLPAPWMAWTNVEAFVDHWLLVRFGLWHQAQLSPSFRWPTWKFGSTPRNPWQALHLALSTMARRAVKPVAASFTFGVVTRRPPEPSALSNGYAGTSVCVSGWFLSVPAAYSAWVG